MPALTSSTCFKPHPEVNKSIPTRIVYQQKIIKHYVTTIFHNMCIQCANLKYLKEKRKDFSVCCCKVKIHFFSFLF